LNLRQDESSGYGACKTTHFVAPQAAGLANDGKQLVDDESAFKVEGVEKFGNMSKQAVRQPA
jgi:hypothetical protein